MFKFKIKEILNKVEACKKDFGFDIVDTHIHPYDVMGVVHYSDKFIKHESEDYLSPGILEILNYGSLEKIGSKLYFDLFPKNILSMIKESYSGVNQDRILDEMKCSLVDKSVLLSLDPWTPSSLVCENYNNKDKFYILASIDIHKIDLDDIEPLIISYKKNYKIVGLKLHPNLQNFKALPSLNDYLIRLKLEKIYEVVSRNNLYILFHGGISNYTKEINNKYGYIERSKTNGLLINFCNQDGKSELFEKYDFPVIIAHVGHYGIANPDFEIVKKLSDRYKNIFFDTSGVSPKVIERSLEVINSDRIIFGSDGLYNKMAYNVAYLFLSTCKISHNLNSLSSNLKNVFSENYYKKILKR